MRRYRVGRRVREYPFTFRRKSLLFLGSTGWKESGYIPDGSNMIFSYVQSLSWVRSSARFIYEDEHTDEQRDFRA